MAENTFQDELGKNEMINAFFLQQEYNYLFNFMKAIFN
jgi:hypothetical protein